MSTDALRRQVYASDGYKPFGEFTLRDVELRAAELQQAAGWGPTARIGAVARAWSELARTMSREGAETVAELGDERATELASRLWVDPPSGGFLR